MSKENGTKRIKKSKKSKRSAKFDSVLKLFTFAYIVITIIFYVALMKMDMIPTFYIVVFTIAEIFFTLSMAMGLVRRHKTYKLNIICLIIVIIVSSIYIFATRYILATLDFIGTMFSEVTETEEYYVVVRKDSQYEKIEDIANKTMYVFQVQDDVKQEIEEKVEVTLENQDSLTQMGNDLLEGKVEAILLGSTQYNMLVEELKTFREEEDVKIIYTATHKVKSTATISNENSKHTIEEGIFNVYISGVDTYGSINNVARSDANILATVNTKTHEVLLTSIPRDYYVTLHSYDSKDKLTHSGIYGIKETVTTIEDLLDIDINYYVRLNFSTVIKVVDTLGGIDVNSEYSFTTTEGYSFSEGNNHINGREALAFSRERKAFENGDNQRVKNQQHVIEAIIKKVLNSTTILTKYTDILSSLEGSFQTNIAQSDISKLVKEQLDNMSSWTIKTNSLVGTGTYAATYSMGSQKLYVMLPDSTSVDIAKEKIEALMGE